MTTDETELCRRVAGWLDHERDLDPIPNVDWRFAGWVLEELARRGLYCQLQVANPDNGGTGCFVEEETAHDTASYGVGEGCDLEQGPLRVLLAADAALGNGGGE